MGFAASFDTVAATPPVAPASVGRARAVTHSGMPIRSSLSFGRSPARSVPVVEPDMSDEEGVEYVKDLKMMGAAVVGETLTAEGTFVGTPTATWHRVTASGVASAVDGAMGLRYTLTADDFGCKLRCECVGEYGGKSVTVDTATAVAATDAQRSEMGKLHKKGEVSFSVRTAAANEARGLLVARDKVKLRVKRGATSKTLEKLDFVKGVTLTLSPDDERLFTVATRGGAPWELLAESGASRDLLALCVRQCAKAHGVVPIGVVAKESDEGSARSGSTQDQGGDGCSDDEYQDHKKDSTRSRFPGSLAEGEEGAEGDGEEGDGEEGFRPLFKEKIKIREAAEVKEVSSAELSMRTRSLSLAAPGPIRGRTRTRGGSVAGLESPQAFGGPPSAAPSTAERARASSGDGPVRPSLESIQSSGVLPIPDMSPATAARSEEESVQLAMAISLREAEEAAAAEKAAAAPAAAAPPAAATPEQATTPKPKYRGGRRVSDPKNAMPSRPASQSMPNPRTPRLSLPQDAPAAAPAASPAPAPPPLVQRASLDIALGSNQASLRDSPDTSDAAASPAAAPASSPPTAVPKANGKGLTPSASTPVLPAKNGGGRPGSKAYELHVTESVHAKFDGKEVREFQALGELRAVQVGGFGAAHSFSLSLEKAEHVIDLQLNDKLLQATDGAYTARLPALEKPTPLPLLRYKSATAHRPIPLKLMMRWSFEAARDRLEMSFIANPLLAMGLRDVAIVVSAHDDATGCEATPPGEWRAERKQLVWTIPLVMPTKPAQAPVYRCSFPTAGGADKAGRAPRPVAVNFVCDGINITGMVPRAAAGAPVGRVHRRFAAGKYVVN